MARNPFTYRPIVDVDMGIGRRYGYDDRARDYHTGFIRGSVSPARNPARCHPTRTAEAHYLCRTCYITWWTRRERLRREIESRFRTSLLIGSRT